MCQKQQQDVQDGDDKMEGGGGGDPTAGTRTKPVRKGEGKVKEDEKDKIDCSSNRPLLTEEKEVDDPQEQPGQQQQQQQQQVVESLNAYARRDAQRRRTEPRFEKIRDERAQLPVQQLGEKVLQALNTSRVLVLQGDTGSGKTTQIAQLILEHAELENRAFGTSIVVTQPRRVAAISAAQRVAYERGERLGNSVGYQVRLERRLPRKRSGTILYCTTGILLAKLRENNRHGLDGVSHLIIDEAHERDIDIDLLLSLLLRLLEQNAQLRVVIMSATIQASLFSAYFHKYSPSHLHIPGRMFPVQVMYPSEICSDPLLGSLLLPDTKRQLFAMGGGEPNCSLSHHSCNNNNNNNNNTTTTAAAEVISKLCHAISLAAAATGLPTVPTIAPSSTKNDDNSSLPSSSPSSKGDDGSGAILVFLPSWESITSVKAALEAISNSADMPTFPGSSKSSSFPPPRLQILPLHSMLPAHEQQLVFKPPPPGCRKIILATNIAETSLTIPDVRYVIDLGLAKELHHDSSRGVTGMQEVFVSQSAATQRKGRAGRTQPGWCFRLYGRGALERAPEHALPEIKRTPLSQLILHVAASFKPRAAAAPSADRRGRDSDDGGGDDADSIAAFLESMIQPPPAAAVALAVAELQEMGALDADEMQTPLGRALSRLPLSPRLAKMLVVGAFLGVLGEVAAVVALESDRSPFVIPPDLEERKKAKEAHAQFGFGVGLGSFSDYAVTRNLARSWDAVLRRSRRDSSAHSSSRFYNEKEETEDRADNRVNDDTSEQDPWEWARERYVSSRRLMLALKVRRQLIRNVDRDLGLTALDPVELNSCGDKGTERERERPTALASAAPVGWESKEEGIEQASPSGGRRQDTMATERLLLAAISSGLFPNVASTALCGEGRPLAADDEERRGDDRRRKKRVKMGIRLYGKKVHIHRSSILFKRKWSERHQEHVAFSEKMVPSSSSSSSSSSSFSASSPYSSSALINSSTTATTTSDLATQANWCTMLKRCTVVSPIALALLGGPLFDIVAADEGGGRTNGEEGVIRAAAVVASGVKEVEGETAESPSPLPVNGQRREGSLWSNGQQVLRGEHEALKVVHRLRAALHTVFDRWLNHASAAAASSDNNRGKPSPYVGEGESGTRSTPLTALDCQVVSMAASLIGSCTYFSKLTFEDEERERYNRGLAKELSGP